MGIDPKILAVLILIISYVALFSEKINRAVVAVLGACVMVLTGILTEQTALKGIDFNTISLLVGMMIIVGLAEKSGMFEYIALYGVKKVKANPRKIMVLLIILTAVLSALIDNVTTVLLIAPVTFQITRRLKISAYPYLLAEIFASNIGGTATLIGDPPNILIGSALNLSFMDFVKELTPVVLLNILILVVVFDRLFAKKLQTTERAQQKVLSLNEKESLTDIPLLIKSVCVLASVLTGFILAEHLPITNGTIALFGAAVFLFLYTLGDNHALRDEKVEDAFSLVDWTTIFFFCGLFAIVFGLEETGVLEIFGEKLMHWTQGSLQKMTYAVLWGSAFLSSAIDNIPFVATMIPTLKSMEESIGGREVMMPVWWALSLGACFGGNGTLIAASANVIVAGIAAREGEPISFVKFLLYSLPVMLVSVALAMAYLYFKFFL